MGDRPAGAGGDTHTCGVTPIPPGRPSPSRLGAGRAEVGTVFALSWLITWYGHVLTDFHHTLRLFDFFLASHPLMPVYFAAAVSAEDDPPPPSDTQGLGEAGVSKAVGAVGRWSCTGRRRCWVPPATCPASTSSSPASRGICPTSAWCRGRRSFSNGTPTRAFPGSTTKGEFWGRRTPRPTTTPNPKVDPARPPLSPPPCRSIAIQSFGAFQRAASCQRPDAVLRRQRREPAGAGGDAAIPLPAAGRNPLVKVAVWGLSATLGAVALAVTHTALDWGPEFLLRLF